MNANFERAKGHRRAIDRKLMNGEWPVLLGYHGQGRGRALSRRRRSPHALHRAAAAGADQCAPCRRIQLQGSGVVHTLAEDTAAAVVALAVGLVVLFAEFPGLA